MYLNTNYIITKICLDKIKIQLKEIFEQFNYSEEKQGHHQSVKKLITALRKRLNNNKQKQNESFREHIRQKRWRKSNCKTQFVAKFQTRRRRQR